MTQVKNNVLCAFAFLLIRLTLSRAQSHPQEFAFERDLESWHRLKRQAGYFTESYVYKGGLYKLARSDESSFYTCSKHNGQYCTEWISTAETAEDTESGVCSCHESDSFFCSFWTCIHTPLGTAHRCGDGICRDANENEHSTCTCSIESANQRYCEEWSCTQINVDGTVDDSHSICLREDSSGQYCARWKEHRVSKREVGGSVCECDLHHHHHCARWVCQGRSMVKCDAYNSRWCNFKLGLGLGGVGAVLMIVSLVVTLKCAPLHRRWPYFLSAVVFFCLPWTIGVAIWGGARAVLYAGGAWGALFILSCLCLCRFRY